MDQFFSDNEALISQVTQIVTEGGVNVLLALGILIIGYMVAGAVKRAVLRATENNDRIDETLARRVGRAFADFLGNTGTVGVGHEVGPVSPPALQIRARHRDERRDTKHRPGRPGRSARPGHTRDGSTRRTRGSRTAHDRALGSECVLARFVGVTE